MATITPVWTSSSVLTSPQCLTRGSTLRTTLDLRAKYGAKIYTGLGRGGTTAITAPGVYFICRAMPDVGTVQRIVVPFAQMNTQVPATGAILKLINNGSNYVAGTSTFTIDGTGSPAVDEWYCFWGVTSIPANGVALATMEFGRVANISGSTSVTLDSPSLFAHNDNEIITNRADCGVFDLPGGALYEFVWDYVAHAAGEAVAIGAWYSTYDSNSAT